MQEINNNVLTQYAIEVSDVSKCYNGFVALKNVSFKVRRGDFVGLLGVNGAGKTSLINAISGVNKYTGAITVMGHCLSTHTVQAKKCLGVVPQEIAFDPFLTVYKTLQFQSQLYGAVNNKEWIFYVLERLGLIDKAKVNVRSLSGGMKRRLMVAQAIVHKPPVIILDEPTAGVDVEIRQGLWTFIKELHANGHTMLLTTHYLEEAEQLCDKLIILHKGKIINDSTKRDFMARSVMNRHSAYATMHLQFPSAHARANLPPILKKYLLQNAITDQVFTFAVNTAGDDLRVILNILHDHNIIASNIEVNQPSLEDVFLTYLERF